MSSYELCITFLSLLHLLRVKKRKTIIAQVRCKCIKRFCLYESFVQHMEKQTYVDKKWIKNFFLLRLALYLLFFMHLLCTNNFQSIPHYSLYTVWNNCTDIDWPVLNSKIGFRLFTVSCLFFFFFHQLRSQSIAALCRLYLFNLLDFTHFVFTNISSVIRLYKSRSATTTRRQTFVKKTATTWIFTICRYFSIVV